METGSMQSVAEQPFRVLATILDCLVIAVVAAVVVLLLGGSPSVDLGGRSVVLPHVWRLAVFAAVVAALRYWIAGRAPILAPLRTDAIRSALDAERERFARPAPAPPGLKYYALAAAVASLLWLTPHLRQIRHVPSLGDPIFSAWRLARFARQLLNDPARLFDGNIFHPAPETLTYSDPTVLEGLVALPFIAAGADPLTVSNALLLASFPLAALAFFYAGWRLTSDPKAGCIAGILGGLSAFKIEHYPHLELQSFWFAPLALIALMRMLAAPSAPRGAIFGTLLVAQWLGSMYFGVMLAVFLTPVALLLAVAWRVRPSRPLSAAVAAASVIVLAGGSITAVPFLRTQEDRGERAVAEVHPASAVPSDYAAANEGLAMYRGMLPRSSGERDLFPGTATLVLGFAGVMPPMSLGTIVLAAGTAVAFDGSLGLNGLIYDDLYAAAAPFRGMRVPARFAAFVGSGLILLSAYGARRLFLLGRTPRRRATLFVLLSAGALVDLRSGVGLMPYFETVPPIYSHVTSDMVLAELPMPMAPTVAYMYFSTFHGARMINGYSGHFPEGYEEFKDAMEHFPTERLLAELRERGVTHVTVNCRLFSDRAKCADVLAAMSEMPELVPISAARWEGADVRLYQLGPDD
jgi:hypothetical protein